MFDNHPIDTSGNNSMDLRSGNALIMLTNGRNVSLIQRSSTRRVLHNQTGKGPIEITIVFPDKIGWVAAKLDFCKQCEMSQRDMKHHR